MTASFRTAAPLDDRDPRVDAEAEAPTLDVRGLSISTGSRAIVDGVDITVRAGEITAIVGESGSGKSVTAKAIMRLLPEALMVEGEIRIGGRSVPAMREREIRRVRGREVAMVLQDPFTVLNPLTTVATHIRETLAVSGKKYTDRQLRSEVVRRLREVGLDPDWVADRYPFELSGGMQQRVAIAGAIANEPRLLIADEPTTALDATTQKEVLGVIRRICDERGMALLLITHDIRVAFAMAQRVIVMYGGRVVEEAAPKVLGESPAHPYSLGLLQTEPSAERRIARLASIPGNVPRADEVADRCAFVDRCRWAAAVCRAGRPALMQQPSGSISACVRVHEIGSELSARVRDQSESDAGSSVNIEAPDREGDPPALMVTGLHKRFTKRGSRGGSGQSALQNVSLSLPRGSSLGVVGESGSGKTTLARCLLGLESLTSGTTQINGLDVSDWKALSASEARRARSAIQCVFQDPYASLNPSHRVGYALAEAIRRRRGKGRLDKLAVHGEVERLLEDVGLPGTYAARKPSELSGGERQRVVIARALAFDPDILVCDEPVAALDVSVQAQVLEVLRAVNARGVSLLFITHDLAVVRQMTDGIVVLRRGEVVERGMTDQVLDAPSHPYTQALVDAVPNGQPDWLSDVSEPVLD